MSYTVVDLPFGAGIDTKTDPKMLDAPKLVALQDGVFTNARRVKKRNGYTNLTNALVGGGTWSNPTMAASFKNELLLAATTSNGGRILSYSKSANAWMDKGKYVSVGNSKEIIAAPIFESGTLMHGLANPSSAISGNYALYCYEDAGGGLGGGPKWAYVNGAGKTYISVKDLQTGVFLVSSQVITNALGFSRAVILGSSTFAVFYISSSATNRLACRIISISSGSVNVGSEVTIGTCASLATMTGQFPYSYDVATISTGAIVAVANQPTVDLYLVDTSGTTTSSTTITSADDIHPISITLDASDNAWIYWTSVNVSSGVPTIYYAIYSSTLSSILSATSAWIGVSDASVQQIVAVNTSSGNQTYYASLYFNSGATNGIGVYNPEIAYGTTTSGGTVTGLFAFSYNYEIYGKPFSVGSSTYLPVMTLSNTNPTGFIIDLSDKLPVAKFLMGEAEGFYVTGYDTSGSGSSTPIIAGVRFQSFPVVVQEISSTLFSIAACFITEQVLTVPSSTTSKACYPAAVATNAYFGVASISFDFDHVDAYQWKNQADTVVLNGSIVSMYDGSQVTEVNFNTSPDGISILPSTGSPGTMTDGTYVYYVTFSWIDNQGRLYESQPSQSIVVIFSGGTTNGKVNIQLQTPTLTAKSNMLVKVWRASALTSGTLAYLVSQFQSTSEFISFTDNGTTPTSDTPTLYTQGGAILDNTPPPPSLVMWTNNQRIWCVDSENPETAIEYCKTVAAGYGISFSYGQLELLVDSTGGNITLGMGMDEKTIIMKENAPMYFFVGDGANDAGQNATYSQPQRVPSEVGCTNSKSAVLFSDGILFRASGNQGIYIFTRGIQVKYFGLDVEAYNAQDIRSAYIVPTTNQIRFLTSSGYSLLYDTVFNQWSVFTNHEGLSATTHGGVYTYVRADGNVYQEDTSGSYLDDTSSYSLSATLSWLKAENIQGFERVRRVMLLGDFQGASNHGVQISAAYDFSSSFSLPVPYYFTGANAAFQYRERLARQKCDAIQLKIEEVVTGASGEYIDFSSLGIEIMPKQGLNKLPATQSVG